MSQYPVYRNDIKFDIDVDDKARFDSRDTELDHSNTDTKSAKYRIKLCEAENYELLDLSHTSFDLINEVFSIFTFKDNVSILTLNDSNLLSIQSLALFSNLLVLDISKNNLKYVPILPPSIEELVASNNLIESLELEPNLKRVVLEHNRIAYIRCTTNIEHLNISNNPIRSIEFEPRCKIKYLNIDNTLISDIGVLSELQTLSIMDSNVRAIRYMPKLSKIVLSASSFDDIKLSKRYTLKRIVDYGKFKEILIKV